MFLSTALCTFITVLIRPFISFLKTVRSKPSFKSDKFKVIIGIRKQIFHIFLFILALTIFPLIKTEPFAKNITGNGQVFAWKTFHFHYYSCRRKILLTGKTITVVLSVSVIYLCGCVFIFVFGTRTPYISVQCGVESIHTHNIHNRDNFIYLLIVVIH